MIIFTPLSHVPYVSSTLRQQSGKNRRDCRRHGSRFNPQISAPCSVVQDCLCNLLTIAFERCMVTVERYGDRGPVQQAGAPHSQCIHKHLRGPATNTMIFPTRTLSLLFAGCLGSGNLPTAVRGDGHTTRYRGTVTVTNLAPANGTCQTPPWVGIHDGTFDTYDGDEPIPEPFQSLAEDGDNNPVIAAFAAANGTVWDGSVGGGPICSGESATMEFDIEVAPGAAHYFSYASMVLPSNDAWVANGNPEEHTVFDAEGAFVPVSFTVTGGDVLDAGTEVNDEIPENTAFFGQAVPGTGDDEVDGVVIDHPGFNAVGSGGILDDPRFANADFTSDGYEMMMIEVEAAAVEDGGNETQTMAPSGDSDGGNETQPGDSAASYSSMIGAVFSVVVLSFAF